MRSSNKSRSRNKNNNRRNTLGNVINRVFDSAGPEGKVRGTPQQVIEKYQTLARDAQLSGDRVAAENFAQHAEHYLRMLGEAQREMAERTAEANERHQQNQQNNNQPSDQDDHRRQADNRDTAQKVDGGDSPQPDVAESSALVDTPEGVQPAAPRAPRKPRARRPAKPAAEETQPAVTPEA